MSGSLNKTHEAVRPDVFNFLDFRKYLLAHYNYKKSTHRGFSYRGFSYAVWARQLCLSTSMLKMIVCGERNLPVDKIQKFLQACELNGWEGKYFTALVQWNQLEDESLREVFWERLVSIAPADQFCYIQRAEEKAVRHWYAFALMEMLQLKDFVFDYQWMADRLGGLVSVESIRSAFEALLNLGLVKMKDGRPAATSRTFMALKGAVSSEVITTYHKETIPLAIQAIDRVPSEEREILSTVVAIPHSKVPVLKQKLQNVQREFLEYVSNLSDCDEVYEMNIQLFPLTRNEGKK